MAKRDKKKLTIEDRMNIQACLHNRQSIKEIAGLLKVSKSTVARELKRNSTEKFGDGFECEALSRLLVCNTCTKRAYCLSRKKFYDFSLADQLSEKRKRMSRSSPKTPFASIKIIDGAVRDGVSLGQSLHHIYVSNPQLRHLCSERTIRRLLYRGNLSVRPHQLRRYPRFRHSSDKTPGELIIRDIRFLLGRTFKDFRGFVRAHRRANVAQFDSVIGKNEDEKAILTITFPKYGFQFGIIIRKGSPASVNAAIRRLFSRIGPASAKRAFPACLCDNGTEFSAFYQNEFSLDGEQMVRTFYATPYRSNDKAECERNHELVRYVIPKGKSLDFLTQDILDGIFSNINSYVRKSKNDKTPYDLVRAKFGQDFLDAIGIKRIPNKKVKLTQLV